MFENLAALVCIFTKLVVNDYEKCAGSTTVGQPYMSIDRPFRISKT